ncbi:MAG: deoxyribonuclease IV, partial [Candidatus Eisenbacteria bacterium]|nr:deoxyribonuclease IV [Candidatus Eisenbacteria bacterium]
FHPGAHRGMGEEHGIRNIVQSLDEVLARAPGGRTTILLETTAGMGSSIGWRFEHLARIIENVKENHRLGVCFDTCHVLSAGYDYRDEEGYAKVMGEFDRLIGIERLRLFHLNDSKQEFNSHLDRHEHIGKGFVGSKAFARILRDPRFRDIPMVLETPKDDEMDRRNLALLRRLGRAAR